jgi:hypothetical protein
MTAVRVLFSLSVCELGTATISCVFINFPITKLFLTTIREDVERRISRPEVKKGMASHVGSGGNGF